MSSSKVSKVGLIIGLLISIIIFTALIIAYLFSIGLAKTALKVELENRVAANESLNSLLQDEKFTEFYKTEKLRLERIAQLQILVSSKDYARAEQLLKNNVILLGEAGTKLSILLDKLKNQPPLVTSEQPTEVTEVIDNAGDEITEGDTIPVEIKDLSPELINEFDTYCREYFLEALNFELDDKVALAYQIGQKLAKRLNFTIPQ